MKSCCIVTGASGHLGSALIKLLVNCRIPVRALAWPEPPEDPVSGVSYYIGDIRDPEMLAPLFEGLEDARLAVIHAAGLIDLSEKRDSLLRQVNVEGTKILLRISRDHGVRRFLYVSSVHAIPSGGPGAVLTEVSSFSPDCVVGAYAKSKALATQAVLDANSPDFQTLTVHPSGIIGPGDFGSNHLVQLLDTYLQGKLPFCIQGGYDFVDVRDVAEGCLAALRRGIPGSTYLLTGEYCEIRDLLNMVRSVKHKPRTRTVPNWLARAAAPIASAFAEFRGQRPLFTPYSLHTLTCGDRFSHEKATRELGYHPRDLRYTVRDTVQELLDRS